MSLGRLKPSGFTCILWCAALGFGCSEDENSAAADDVQAMGGEFRDLSGRLGDSSADMPSSDNPSTQSPMPMTGDSVELTDTDAERTPRPGSVGGVEAEAMDEQDASTAGHGEFTPMAGVAFSGGNAVVGGRPDSATDDGDAEMDFPGPGGRSNMGRPPRGGRPNMGLPPRGGQLNMEFPPRGGRPDVGLEPACTRDDDCLANQLCLRIRLAQRCEARPACERDRDCRMMFRADALFCNQNDGLCERTTCMRDGQCGPAHECIDRRCQRRQFNRPDGEGNQRCVQDENCEPGQVCRVGRCIDDAPALGQEGEQCMNDRNCETGFICDRMQGQCRQGCRDDRSCPPEQICNLDTARCQAERRP